MMATTQFPNGDVKLRSVDHVDGETIMIFDNWCGTKRWVYELTLHTDGAWTLMRGEWGK